MAYWNSSSSNFSCKKWDRQAIPNKHRLFHSWTTSKAPFSHSISQQNEMAPPKSTSSSTGSAIQQLWKSYLDDTPSKLKTIDAFLVFIMLSGIFQFLYCILVTNFPFNAFLSGYVVLRLIQFWPNLTQALCLFVTCSAGSPQRLDNSFWQPHSGHRSTRRIVSSSRLCLLKGLCRVVLTSVHIPTLTTLCRAFADFAMGSIVLHFFVFNFLG